MASMTTSFCRGGTLTDLAPPIVIRPSLALREFPGRSIRPTLSMVLRTATEAAHKDVERRLALPDSIHSLRDYENCLRSFYQLYRPLEAQFLKFSDWTSIGLDPNSTLSARLAADLEALGISAFEVLDAPPAALPQLSNFSRALGACYVLEGSALGSQFMLPQLQQTLGNAMTEADSFFCGRGTETGAFWKRFRTTLDLYGESYPEKVDDVVCGSLATFSAIGFWMQP